MVNLPVTWSGTENIAWKRELPGPGASSPAVWNDRIYITAYSNYQRNGKTDSDPKDIVVHLLCLSSQDGSTIWEKSFKPERVIEPSRFHGAATPTPAVDDSGVYVSFGYGGVFRFSHDGEKVWTMLYDGENARWGAAASPVLSEDKVFLNASSELAGVMALDKATGKMLWQRMEDTYKSEKNFYDRSWSTPVLVNADGREELIVTLLSVIRAFDPDTGETLYDIKTKHGYATATPVVHDGVVYSISADSHAHQEAVAFRPGKVEGDRVLWRQDLGVNASSPVFYQRRLYWAAIAKCDLKIKGFYCLNPEDGEIVYKKMVNDVIVDKVSRVPTQWAAALAGDGRIYHVTQEDGTYVFQAGDEYKLLACNRIETDQSPFNASPVPLRDGRLLLRSDWGLYCIQGQSTVSKK